MINPAAPKPSPSTLTDERRLSCGGVVGVPRTCRLVRGIIAFEDDSEVGQAVVAEAVFALGACMGKDVGILT